VSTCADAKTTPVTPEYASNHERIFGERSARHGTYVMRCSACDGVTHPEGARLYRCGRCGADTYGALLASEAPAFNAPPTTVPVVTDRHYEGIAATDGTDIGSRVKRREYMRRNALADADDFKGEWSKAQKERDAMRRGEHDRRERREAIGRAAYEVEKKNARRR
jgi:hypothetical protein